MTVIEDELRKSLGLLTEDISLSDEDEVCDLPPKDPPKLELKEVETTVPTYYESDIANDYRFARQVIYTLIENTGSALAGALEVAQQSEHPRAYGVFNELANTMKGLTSELMGMQKVFKEVTKDKDDKKIGGDTNIQVNNYGGDAVGGTTSILDVLEKHGLEGGSGMDDIDIGEYPEFKSEE